MNAKKLNLHVDMKIQAVRQFHKITLMDGHTYILGNAVEGENLIYGVECTIEGDMIEPRGFSSRVRVIAIDAVKSIKLMRMNLKYGQLEIA